MRAVQLLRGSPRRKAVAGFAAAITVVTSFFVVQGLAGADVVTAPPTKLLAVGPTSPDNGFPVWYKDSNNLSVGLCLDDTNAFCNITAADVPDVTQPVSFPDNFPDETFYQLAQSQLALPNGTTAVLNDNIEAAFNTPGPAAGQQITFGRVRIRITTPSTGHYVITHPYGVDAFDVTDTADRNINFTEDIGIGDPGNFKGALGSRINPFLRWDTGLIKGPDGASYLGDGVTAHAVTGSDLNTNFFRIDGPDIGGPGVNTDPDQPVHPAGPGRHERRRLPDPGHLHPLQHQRRVRRRVRRPRSRTRSSRSPARASARPSSRPTRAATTSAGSPSPAPTHRPRSKSPTPPTDHRPP